MAWSVAKAVHLYFQLLHQQAAAVVVLGHLTQAAQVVQAVVVVKVPPQAAQEIHLQLHPCKAKMADQVLQVRTAQAVVAAAAVKMA
jgi:hypothetical protein